MYCRICQTAHIFNFRLGKIEKAILSVFVIYKDWCQHDHSNDFTNPLFQHWQKDRLFWLDLENKDKVFKGKLMPTTFLKDFLPKLSKPVISRALKSLDKKDLINRLERSGCFNILGEPPDQYASGEYTKFIQLTCKGRDYISRRKQVLNANFVKMEKLALSES